MISFQTFMANWLGKRVDTDGEPAGYPFQCVDLIKQWLHEGAGLAFGAFGNAIDYWIDTNSAILRVCDRITFDGYVVAGDVLPLKPVDSQPAHKLGHIVIATGNTSATQVEILEQNGGSGNGLGQGSDLIRTRWIDKSRIYGVLRLKAGVTAAPAPAPQPAGDTYEVHQELAGYTNAANANAHVSSNSRVPAGVYAVFNRAGDMINVTRQAGVPGWWINPRDNILTPAPAEAPAGPTPHQDNGSSFTVGHPVPGYVTSANAMQGLGSNSTVPAGTYAVFNRANGAINVTRQAGTPGWWLNPNA